MCLTIVFNFMPVQYDSRGKVLKPYTEHAWTQEMVLEVAKCAKSVKYFAINHCRVVHPVEGIIPMQMRPYQMEMLDILDSNQKSVFMLGRQMGKSMTVGIYILWFAMFNTEPVNIFILANKGRTAAGLLSDIKTTYEELEPYIKRGVTEYNKTSVQFDNGSVIQSSNTTESAIRGESVSLLLLDEFAHVPPHIAEPFYESAQPTISTGGKIVLISTPKGNTGQFFEIFTGAEQGKNGYCPFKATWELVPGRDEKWKEETIKDIGEIRFNQEHNCSFIGSSATLINGEILKENLLRIGDEPAPFQYPEFDVWEKPKQGHIYVMGIDVSKGVGKDFSVIQVVDISSNKFRQVACYASNSIDPFDFTKKILEIGQTYNNAYAAIENNTYGYEVCRTLWEEHFYENLYKEGHGRNAYGISASVKSKALATSILKRQMEQKIILLRDKKTLKEMFGFIEIRPNIYGCEGGNAHDDRVMALCWALYFTQSRFWQDIKEYVMGQTEFVGGQTKDIEDKQTFDPPDFGKLMGRDDKEDMFDWV